MNPMFDFNAREISLIQLSLSAIAQTTQHAITEGVYPPDGFIEALESVVDKLNAVVEARIENDNKFESIIQSLPDVEQSLNALVRNPDIEIDEYN